MLFLLFLLFYNCLFTISYSVFRSSSLCIISTFTSIYSPAFVLLHSKQLLPSLSSVYICAIARQCLHLTSLLFLVPDVLRSCCKPYCRFQLLNLLQFRACCFVFLYSRGHSFWSDERAGGRVASIHFVMVTRQTDLV